MISMHEYFESPQHFSIILNAVNGKPLLNALKELKSGFTQKVILSIIIQLGRAVRHLKAKNIIWCNFSHENIIYDGETAVICGFSKSRIKISRTMNIDKRVLGLRGTSFLFIFFLNFVIID